ncbi:helix-turn-helix domain-containing protein [Streptomyces sp. NPDC056309]|uniref:AraC-like ligand-binding domain-containing protein n=1 Tax=unclassified Streptomyces TaxID=2593676 RepID=UPI0035D6EECD
MIEFSTRDVPPADRFDWWVELTSRDLLSTRITCSDTAGFSASARHLELGQVRVSMLEFPDLRSVRTQQLIQRSDPELWEVGVVLEGAMTIEQARSTVALGPDDLVVWDSSREFDSAAFVANGPPRLIVAHLPRRAVPVPEQVLRGLAARPLPARAGAGALLKGFLRGLVEQAPSLSGTGKQAQCLGATTLDLAAAFLAGIVDADVPEPTRKAALLLEIKKFIQRNLGTPELSPGAIAAAHNMSLRSLHYLFQEERLTVAGFVREERLERCRTELAAPGLSHRSVGKIGSRWGFPDPAAFSRAFKARYGSSPGEFRRRHLQNLSGGSRGKGDTASSVEASS